MKHDPRYQDMLTFEQNGERYSAWFLQAKNRDDLRKRMNAHKLIADQTCSMMGRSMDHVSGFVTGMSTNPSVFDTENYKFADNSATIITWENDTFATYAVLPPQPAIQNFIRSRTCQFLR